MLSGLAGDSGPPGSHQALSRQGPAGPQPVEADSAAMPAGGIEQNPLERLERKELCRRILAVVETLPQKYREVFLLAHSGQLTYAQMAEVLDVPVTTMQIRLVRARRMVQNQLIDRNERKVRER